MWWTTHPVRAPVLVGWAGGPKALSLSRLASEHIEDAAIGALARGTVFFAGEAADPEWRTGTVHGAIATGRRAAEEVMRSLTARSSAATRAGSD